MESKTLNWNYFKINFAGNEQNAFEWLSYLAFCHELKIPYGIFRYYNQAGLETNPVPVTGDDIDCSIEETGENEKKELCGF